MSINLLRGGLAGVVCLALVLAAGCALDPMERLSEEIDSQDVSVRRAAVLELANLRDERAIEALVEVLEGDEELYDMAGVALVKHGRERVTVRKPDPVVTMVAGVMNNMHVPQPNRARAAWVLGEIGDREAIPALRTGSIATDPALAPAVPVRTQATIALKKLGDSSEGVAFELPLGTFASHAVDVLPTVEPVAEPEVDEDEEEEEEPEEEEEEDEEVEDEVEVAVAGSCLPV